MSKSIKAFAQHDFFVTNTRMEEHRFGELSTDSRTYEKDIALYTHNTDKSITLALFRSTDNNRRVEIAANDLNLTLDIVKHIYDYVLRSAREIYVDELKRNLLDTFRTRAQMFQLGNVVTDGNYYCVQWVSWKDNNNNEFHVWFSDKSFKSEYDDYEIEIVPPVDAMDVFFTTRTQVEAELAKTPVNLLTKKANAKKGSSPVTVFRLDIFKWHNPVNRQAELDTNWYVLIWGDAGDNIDSVREKIQDTILANSSHSRDEWKEVFPEIFKRNEFIIVPQWDVFSNENKVKEKASLYSPAMNYKEAFTKYGKPFMNEMPDAHIQDNLQVTSMYYRSITSSVCGSPENRDNKFKIRDMFPDFIDVPSTSTDFNYQSTRTQNWSLKLQDMMTVAEEMTPTSTLPRERLTLPGGEIINGDKIYTRVTRNGKLFLVMNFEGFHYLVAAKYNFNKK